MLRRITLTLLAMAMLFVSIPIVVSAEADYKSTASTANGFSDSKKLFDKNRATYTSAVSDATVTFSRNDGIAHLYVEFDRLPPLWTLEDPESGKTFEGGTKGFLHEYIDINSVFGYNPKKLNLKFPKGTSLADLYAFSEGELPDFVQIWDEPYDKADILLISTHSDDEQLFFLGILPYYVIERKMRVQVVYVVQHFETRYNTEHIRPHEQLDGLYAMGVRNYPTMSDIPDLYAESKDPQKAFNMAIEVFKNEGNVTHDDFKSWIVENIRRFKPQVVISHDLKGEYGHGAHVLVATALTEVITYSEDPTKFPESAEKYGLWTPKKTYLHLYEENQIVMDWDTPYDSLGGKTPFEMSQIGFGYHKSQHWTWFYPWIYGKNGKKITKATEIEKFSPCNYGLYQTSVGEDVLKNDFTENIVPYDLQPDPEEEETTPPEASEPETEETVPEAVSENESVAEQKDESKSNGLYIWLAVLLTVSIVSVIVVCFMPRKRKFR